MKGPAVSLGTFSERMNPARRFQFRLALTVATRLACFVLPQGTPML